MEVNKEALQEKVNKVKENIDKALLQYCEYGAADIKSLAAVASSMERMLATAFSMEQPVDVKATKSHVYKSLQSLKEALDKITPEYIQGALVNAQQENPMNKDQMIDTLLKTLPENTTEEQKKEQIAKISEEFDKLEASGEFYKQSAYVKEYNSLRSFATDVLLMACYIGA